MRSPVGSGPRGHGEEEVRRRDCLAGDPLAGDSLARMMRFREESTLRNGADLSLRESKKGQEPDPRC